MTEKIMKMSHKDIYEQLSNKTDNLPGYLVDYDLDKGEAYIAKWTSEGRELYSYSFKVEGNVVSLDRESGKHKVAITSYEDAPDEDEPVTMSKIKSFIKSLLTTKDSSPHLPLMKQFEDEEMVSLEFLYIKPDTFDAHNHTISREDTELMVKSFMDNLPNIKPCFAHKHETDRFSIVKAWVNPHDCTIGETFVPEGQPICQLKWNTVKAWNARKSGVLAGVSIGCKAELEDIEDEA